MNNLNKQLLKKVCDLQKQMAYIIITWKKPYDQLTRSELIELDVMMNEYDYEEVEREYNDLVRSQTIH